MFDAGSTLIGGAFLGTLIALWNNVKTYLSKFYGLFIVRIKIFDTRSPLANSTKEYLINNFRCRSFSSFIYYSYKQYVRPLAVNRMVIYKDLPDEATIYWKGFKPLFFEQRKEEGVLSFLRGTFSEEEILKGIEETANSNRDEHNDRFYVRRYMGQLALRENQNSSTKSSEQPILASDGRDMMRSLIPTNWKKDELGQPKNSSPLEHLSLDKNCLEAIEEAKRWIKSEKWFKDHMIPHKRGWLLYGKPGTGKTSFIRGLAQEINVPILIFDLSTMSNKDFQDYWDSILEKTPCIALFEDIDGVFDGRKNLSKIPGALTFDCFLNCIDGIENTDGVFIMITTNKIENVDSAIGISTDNNMSSRPGRIDRTIEMRNPGKDGRRKIALRILRDFPSEIEKLIEEGENDTGAQFQERCARLALKLFWNDKAV